MQLWRTHRDAALVSYRSGKDEELLDAYSSAVVSVVEAVSPSVVHVQVRGSRRGQPAQGSGSGTILSPDGIVLTNNHVVEGASAIELALNDARRVSARVLGRDPDTDIAVLRAETGDRLPAARLGCVHPVLWRHQQDGSRVGRSLRRRRKIGLAVLLPHIEAA